MTRRLAAVLAALSALALAVGAAAAKGTSVKVW